MDLTSRVARHSWYRWNRIRRRMRDLMRGGNHRPDGGKANLTVIVSAERHVEAVTELGITQYNTTLHHATLYCTAQHDTCCDVKHPHTFPHTYIHAHTDKTVRCNTTQGSYDTPHHFCVLATRTVAAGPHIYTYAHTHMHLHTHIHLYIHTYTQTHRHTRPHTSTHIHVRFREISHKSMGVT